MPLRKCPERPIYQEALRLALGCSQTASVATLVMDTTVARAIDQQVGYAGHFIFEGTPPRAENSVSDH